jgi:hypothetical protein
MSNSIFIRQAQREHLRDIHTINAESSPGVTALTADADVTLAENDGGIVGHGFGSGYRFEPAVFI